MKKRILSVLLIVALMVCQFSAMSVGAAATDDGLILWYKFNETSGKTAYDSSGKGNNGTLNGSTTWLSGNGIELDGKSGYVQMPSGILSGMSEITVSTRVYVDSSNTFPSWIFDFATTTDSYNDANAHYLGLLLNASNYRVMLTKTHWSNEQSTTVSSAFTTGMWKYVTYTQTGKIGTLYLDGVQVAQNTNVTYSPKDIETTVANFIGRAPYTADNYFKGKISDFRLYNRALSEAEVEEISDSGSSEIVELDKQALDLGDLTNVTTNITLPTSGTNGSEISWLSSDDSIVSSTGIVTRPKASEGDKSVTLTAKITKGGATSTKEFTVTVKALEEGQNQVIEEAKSKLLIQNTDDIRGNITLPETIDCDGKMVDVLWTTDRSDIVNVNETKNSDYDSIPPGVITRPDEDTTVKLTANMTYGEATDTKDIAITVKAKPEDVNESDYKEYLFAYFNGTSRSDAEQIYFASSKDGLSYDELNDGNPVLTSILGDKGVRDPFIMRSHEGDKFYLLGTDLRIANGAGWSSAQTAGSKSLAIWESDDLVNWSDERLVKVSLDTAGCTWAPEATYDEKTGEYLVYWASRVSTDNYGKQRIYVAKTRDFYTFTTPEIWVERDNDVIDATTIEYNGTYYRFSKDETNKNIVIDKNSQLLHSTFEKVASESVGSQSGVEGPTCFKLNGENKWVLLLDHYGEGGYYPMVSNDIASGEFTKLDSSEYNLPSGPRHGTVMSITQKEYDAVTAKWGKAIEKEQQDPVLEYKFDETSTDKTILDSSGNSHTGTLNGNAKYATDSEKNSQVLYLDGTTGTFASFPQGFFDDRDTMTISMDVKPETVTGDFFTFTIGQDSNKYMFLRTRDTQIRNAITTGSYSTEEEVKSSIDSIADKWINVKIVITPNSMALYKDGVLLSKNSNVTISMSDLGSSLLSYLGKSFYSADKYFKGYFDNIKVYNRALTETEIAQDYGITDINLIKSVSAEGYNVITTKSDTANKNVKVYFSKNNSTEKDLKAVPLKYELSDGCTIDGTNGQSVDLTTPASVKINLPDESQQIWTVEGIFCNNPALGGEYADPNIAIFNGKYYIYPTTDGYSGWSGTQFHAFSSDDLVNWTDEGVILDAGEGKDVSWAHGSAWAPTIAEKNGIYYFYFCAKNSSGTSCIGVATSTSPTGPFKAENEPLLTPTITEAAGIKVGQTIDPSVFTDDDGKSYVIFGNGSPAIVELNDDMMSINTETMKNLTGATDFRESMIVTKRDGLYHFTWSCDDTGSEDYHVNYGTSDSLYGPITYKYTLLAKNSDKDILGTGHHSIIKIPGKDEYYIAYHRFVTPLGQYSSGLGYHRETCIDKLEFDKDTGLMKVVTPTLEGITEPVTIQNSSNVPYKIEITKNDETLTAKLLNEDGSEFTTDAAVKYEWYGNDELIEDENSATYNLSENDKGKKINVKIEDYNLVSDYIYIDDDQDESRKITSKEIPDGAYDFTEQVQEGLDAVNVSNDTQKADVLDSVKSYIKTTTESEVEISIEDYDLTKATNDSEGKIVGTVVINCDDYTSKYGFYIQIPKDSSDTGGGYDFTQEVNKALGSITVNNSTTSDEILGEVKFYVQATTEAAIEISIKDYVLNEATYSNSGNITGIIIIKCNGYSSEYGFDLNIAMLESTIDKSNLKDLYDTYKSITQGKYTNYTWAIFVAAINNAETVITNDNSTEEEVSNAYNNLKAAIEGLDVTSNSGSSNYTKAASISNDTEQNSTDQTAASNSDEGNSKAGWNFINGKWYMFDKTTGKIITGWYNDGRIWYYLGSDGAMTTGWFLDKDGKWYCLNESGAMQIGWFKDINGNWYYLNESGAMQTGWFEDSNNNWYYLKSNGVMAYDEYVDGYYLGSDGAWAMSV